MLFHWLSCSWTCSHHKYLPLTSINQSNSPQIDLHTRILEENKWNTKDKVEHKSGIIWYNVDFAYKIYARGSSSQLRSVFRQTQIFLGSQLVFHWRSICLPRYQFVFLGLWFLFRPEIFFSDNTRVGIFIVFVVQNAIFFLQNLALGYYDKKSESYFFFFSQNQNIFSATHC